MKIFQNVTVRQVSQRRAQAKAGLTEVLSCTESRTALISGSRKKLHFPTTVFTKPRRPPRPKEDTVQQASVLLQPSEVPETRSQRGGWGVTGEG